MTVCELRLKAVALRRAMLQLIFNAVRATPGGGLSSLDIMNVLYNRVLRVSPETFGDPHRDRYVQSKGHCIEALYAVLDDRRFFPASHFFAVTQLIRIFVAESSPSADGTPAAPLPMLAAPVFVIA